MRKIKLIASDLDGTLLTDDKKISPNNLKAMKDASAKGIHFVPATGRALFTMPENITGLDFIDYAITSNGAAIVDMKTKNAIYKKQLDRETAFDIINFGLEMEIMVEIFVDGKAYVLKKFMDSLENYGVNPRFIGWYTDTRNVVDSFGEILTKNVTVENINMVFSDMNKRKSMAAKLMNDSRIEVTNSIGNNIETGAAGCSKGCALEELCHILDIDMENVMCLGDNYNDADMLKKAGIGVAMANGEDNIKAFASYVAKSNNDDGFAEAVHKFALD